jgi:ABC-type transport system involved in multi-copper enzyme maturation permease subunit
MRSSFAAALMGIGGIFIAFGSVVFVLAIFASRSDPEHKLATMSALAVSSLVAGAVLFGLGFLLNRIGRSTRDGALGTNR